MSSFLTIKTKSRGSQKKPLIIIVGKKVAKKAVERNLLKRRIKAIMRPVLKRSKLDYAIFVRSEAREASFKELGEEINSKIL